MRSQTSASVFGASDTVFMGSILPLNGAALQENDAMARPHVRPAQRLLRACRPSTRNSECQLACLSPSSYDSWHASGLVLLFVADLFHPLDQLPVKLFLDGDVRHGRIRRGAVPVLPA